jgi:hypothetical protein
MRKIKKAVHPRKKITRTPMWPFVVIGLSAAWVTFGFVDRAIAVPGYTVLLIVGAVIATVGGIRMAISPFQESASCGLMYTYVPRYWFYYLVTRKQRMLRPFLWHLCGDVLAIASFVALSAKVAIDPVRMHTNSISAVAAQAWVPTIIANGDDPGH